MTHTRADLNVVAWATSLAICAIAARGQEPLGPATNQPLPAEAPSVRGLLESVNTVYARLHTYEDTVTLRVDVDASPEIEAYMFDSEVKGTLAFEAPNRIAEVWPSWAIICDGRTLWVCDFGRRTYTQTDAPAGLDELHLRTIKESLAINQRPDHMVTAILSRRQQPAPLLLRHIDNLDRATPREVAGQPVFRLEGTCCGGPVATALVINREPPVLSAMEMDITQSMRDTIPRMREWLAARPPDDEQVKPYRQMAELRPEDIKRVTQVCLMEKIVVDGVIPPERFTYVPEPDMKRVERFEGGGAP